MLNPKETLNFQYKDLPDGILVSLLLLHDTPVKATTLCG